MLIGQVLLLAWTPLCLGLSRCIHGYMLAHIICCFCVASAANVVSAAAAATSLLISDEIARCPMRAISIACKSRAQLGIRLKVKCARGPAFSTWPTTAAALLAYCWCFFYCFSMQHIIFLYQYLLCFSSCLFIGRRSGCVLHHRPVVVCHVRRARCWSKSGGLNLNVGFKTRLQIQIHSHCLCLSGPFPALSRGLNLTYKLILMLRRFARWLAGSLGRVFAVWFFFQSNFFFNHRKSLSATRAASIGLDRIESNRSPHMAANQFLAL